MVSRLKLGVDVDVSGAEKLSGIGDKLSSFGKNATKFVTLPLAAAGVAAFKFASDADEATNKAATVFGDAFGSIADDAQSTSDALSESQFLDFAGTFGAIAQGMGETRQESADLSAAWLGMAEDFSSFNNVPIEESLVAIRSALSGEFEPLKRFGVLLNVAKVEAKAVELGLIKEGEALTDNARLLATNALITEGMGAAQGDFARTSEGAANSMKTLAANAVDLAADIGTQLLPIGITLLNWVKDAIGFFTGLPEPIRSVIVPIAALAAAIGPLSFVTGKLIGTFQLVQTAVLNIPTALGYMDLALGKAKTAFLALRAVMLANPFLALAVAVIAIAALIILNWDKIVGFLKGVWSTIQKGIGGLVDFFTDAWEGLLKITTTVWETLGGIIRGAINGFIDIINGFFSFLNGLSFGAGPWDIGPIHVDAISIDPFNIGLIPHLASGGIIDSPTLALLGEKGREAVIPLDRIPSLGGGNSYTFNIEGQIEDADQLVDIFERSQRLNRALAG